PLGHRRLPPRPSFPHPRGRPVARGRWGGPGGHRFPQHRRYRRRVAPGPLHPAAGGHPHHRAPVPAREDGRHRIPVSRGAGKGERLQLLPGAGIRGSVHTLRLTPGKSRWCNVTVAQGMEEDGKKEDLTVLLRTSTHRTQKVRSSMEIVQRLRQRYLQFLQVVVDVLTDEVSYRDFEDRLRQELDALGRDIVKWVVESCDERLREEPQARPGW